MVNPRITIEVNDKMLEETYQLLKRTRKPTDELDCARWTILWTMLNTHEDNLRAMCGAVVSIDLEGRRKKMKVGAKA